MKAQALELMRANPPASCSGVPTMCKTLLQATEGIDDVPQLEDGPHRRRAAPARDSAPSPSASAARCSRATG